jgi:SWI/SNF-related matrix-associated actin-dependent regulator of chromatin subfamily A member 5
MLAADCGAATPSDISAVVETPVEISNSSGEGMAANDVAALKNVQILEQSPLLTADLHQHQVQGISWMVHMYDRGMPMILGDQMGLGKTVQTIGFLAYIRHFYNQSGPHLIVVPLSVMSNWISEIERFCPTFRAIRFHGPKEERNRIKNEEMASLAEFDIVVTTFEILVSECNFFRRKFLWTCLIVDEGHRLKNVNSQLSDKLRLVPCLSKVILTGTPLQNNLKELWALFHFLCPEIFTLPTASLFEDGFDLQRGVIDTNILRKARKLLSLFMLRRVKDQVAIKLPSKREMTVLVPLTDNQIAWYKQLLCGLDPDTIEMVMKQGSSNGSSSGDNSSSADRLSAPSPANAPCLPTSSTSTSAAMTTSSGDSEWRKLMNLLLQLRKICNHVYLMPGGMPEPYYVTEDVVGGSGKLLMLDRMLPRLKEKGHRVLLFSQFTSMLDILEDYCELRGHSYVRLDGETNRVKRRLDVRRFNALRSSIFVFLISTRAGGLGLNLASADTVILYDSDWNPQVDLQAMERAHRIGQTKPVRIYRLICRGSVEERIVLRAEKKLFLNAIVAETDPDEMMNEHVEGSTCDSIGEALGIGGGTAMSKAELASLIRFGANAVFESVSQGVQITDTELHQMLELDGRDLVSIPSAPSSENLATADEDLRAAPGLDNSYTERFEKLQEVDLRQLGDVVFTKKVKKVSSSTLNESNIMDFDAKRARKERIVMVDGKGTGYGGAVPMLADQVSTSAEPVAAPSVSLKTRQWEHLKFCGFCGKSKFLETMSRCAHCPRAFHADCMQEKGLSRGTGGMFICPHHKCVYCYRSTASAGGMLFRCIGCLTAYCEDCLPQDEIESVGRCRELEYLGYDSKQSYYIKCPTCCMADNVKAKGIDGSGGTDGIKAASVALAPTEKSDGDYLGTEGGDETSDPVTDGSQVAVAPTEDLEATEVTAAPADEDEPPSLLPSQTMRMVWVEYPDSEEERKKKKLQKQLEREEAKRKEAELRALAAESRALAKQQRIEKIAAEKEAEKAAAKAASANNRRSSRLAVDDEGLEEEAGDGTPKKSAKKSRQDDGRNSTSRKKARHSTGTAAGADAENDGSDDGALTELPKEAPVSRRRLEVAEYQPTQQTPKRTPKQAVSVSKKSASPAMHAPVESPPSSSAKRKPAAASLKSSPAKHAPVESPSSSSAKRKPAATSLKSSFRNSPRNQPKVEQEEAVEELIDMSDAALTLLTHPITAYSDDIMQSMLLIQSKMDTGQEFFYL